MVVLCSYNLCPQEGGTDVQTGRVWVRNPVLIHLHQLPDALQQLGTIKTLQINKENEKQNCSLVSLL